MKELQEDKQLMQAEERITEEVRTRILEIKSQVQKEEEEIVKRQGTTDVKSKLEERI